MVFARTRSFARRAIVALVGAGLLLSAFGSVEWGRGGHRTMVAARIASAAAPAKSIRLYYSPPVLVRVGERVVMPVDVVCATADGTACDATVELGTQVGSEPWRSVRAAASAEIRFDLTGPAGRAAASSRVARFFLRAADRTGKSASLGGPTAGTALRFYVTDRMDVVEMPSIPFGQVRLGRVMLSLPWGSGPARAGLEPGNESDTVGPSSFDVDSAGRIYLLDAIQQRLAVFEGGRLTRQVPLSIGGMLFDVRVGDDGSAYVLSRGSVATWTVQPIDAEGKVGAPASLGERISARLRIAGRRAFAELLPLDAWVEVPTQGRGLASSPSVRTGQPLASGAELLRLVGDDSVRMATLSDGEVTSAVEVRSSLSIADAPLVEPDGEGGYWLVVRVWQGQPAADQYQVAHVRGSTLISSFAISSRSFANTPFFNRFRLGPDGALYELTSSSEGIQVIRYELGGQG
jgi:hypothetical protein